MKFTQARSDKDWEDRMSNEYIANVFAIFEYKFIMVRIHLFSKLCSGNSLKHIYVIVSNKRLHTFESLNLESP